MDMDIYQVLAGQTAAYPDKTELPVGLTYCALKLAGEAGEYAEKIGKLIRDDGGRIDPAKRLQLLSELGDVLWYVARSAYELGANLGDVANANLEKLKSRHDRNLIHGAGDNR